MAIIIDIKKKILSANGEMTLDINTILQMGELTTLFGKSGAGKTTLLRIIAGLVKPDSGKILVKGQTWFDSDKRINLPPQQRGIGFMFQDYALFPNMTVEENIAFAQKEKNKDQITNLINSFGLSEFRKRKPSGLSGGQKQRVALARALAHNPKLLLLDEPLSALDASMRNSLQNEIANANQIFGATILLVSHDMTEVFRLSNHVVCIDNGKVSKTGTPEKVFSDTSISGKFQIIGQVACIDKQDVVNIITVITGSNMIVKVIAVDDDSQTLAEGDHVLVFSKAFNPIIKKI
jgi:molybdate transport system ATP-binding protein